MKTELLGKEIYLVRSKRKSIGIEIKADGKIVVKAPRDVPMNILEQILKKKMNWIESKQDEMIKYRETIPVRKYESGEVFLFLGNHVKVLWEESKVRSIKGIQFSSIDEINKNKLLRLEFPSDMVLSADRAKDLLEAAYVKLSQIILYERVQYYMQIMQVKPNEVRIKNQKTRWGSCSSKRNINLNYRLIMAPLEVIDYVVVHELSHLIELNHSKAFWQKVKEVLPDYEAQKNWLKQNGSMLTL